jgi:NADH:ubiquinone oxidoreductase subunit 4 (subunit M)
LSVIIPAFVFVGLILFIGIYPKILTDVLDSSASEFLNRTTYIKNIIP